MSRSNSVGDLVPRDITEILALQSGKKKRGSSLGRAFSWFRGSKRKRSVSNGQSRTGGPSVRTGENSTPKQIHASNESSKAGQKQAEQGKLTVHYTASQHYQENVFIEGSRPQYLEDLHTEALEGLKILQQEEHKNEVDFQNDETVLERDVSSREGDESLETDSTAGQSVNSVSTVSAVSSRPVLTRQGSTFKPLNPVKRLDKTRRRPRRTTIMGIPQQVHKELSLARGTTLEQLPNGEHDDEDDSSGTVVIPTINGEVPAVNHEGARVHLQNIEALQTSRDEELLKHHIQSVYQDDFALNRKLGPGTSPMQRPKSLAVSGMTTSSFLQEPQGPVMSISPQATYLSKIIPNAILPAAIDIIEINRDHNKCSGSMVSKSSLSSASPSSLRSRGGTNEDAPTTSQIGSHSQSSETIVSNSSTVSSKGRGPPTHATDSTKEVLELNPKDMSVTNSNSWISSDSKGTNQRLEHTELNDARENVRNSRSFSRSLSVMKTKLPPAPPQRTYSLHHEKIKRRSREQTEIHKINHMAPNDRQTGEDLINGKEGNQSPTNEKSSVHSAVPCSLNDSQSSAKSCPLSPDKPFTGSLAGSSNSSPQKTASGENKFDRTLSPSSGYSSQSGTPTHSPKEVSPSSPGKRRVKPSKPERAGVRTSPLVSVSSSMTSLSSVTSDATHQDIQTNTTPSEPLKILPPVPIVKNKVTPTPPTITLREVFNIPPPPKVKAPSPPPPETWVHNKRTFELLCGPGPNPHRLNLQKQQKEPLICKNQKTDTIPNSEQIFLEQQTSKEIKTGSRLENKVTVEEQNESIPPQEQMIADPTPLRHCESLTIHNNDKESPVLHVKEASQIIQTQDPRNVENQNKQANETVPKRELPTIEVDQSMLSQTNCTFNKGAEFHKTPNPKIDVTDAENQRNCIKDISNHKPMQTLGIEVPEVNGISPPPSPPPAHHPPPPPAKKSSSFLVPTSPSVHKHKEETAKEAASLESSWPPPPPPMDEAADLMLEDQEELDFPPPPPSFTHEPFPEMSDNCHHESCDQQANIELLADSDVKTNLPTTVQDCTVTEGRQHAKPQSCNNISLDQRMSKDKLEQVEKITLPSLEAPPTEPTMLTQDSSEQTSPANPAGSTDVPLAPPLPVEDHSTVNFRRQLNLIHKDNKSKELLSRHKSAPMPKEDANIPLVTPSLLQMVRLRSVNVGEDPVNNDNKSSMETIVTEDQNISSQTTPQKPIRKSLTLKTIPPAFKPSPATVAAPSMCLQEAIRMKTAAMSSSGVPPALNLRLSSTGSTTSPVPSPKTPEGCDLHKSPASTASFIFSKSTKKVVIETPTPPEVQASLKHNLVAEIMQVSEPAKMMITNGTKKPIKVPPPVAKKPAHGTNPPNKTENTTADKTEGATNEQKVRVEVNGQSVTVHSATKVFVGSQDQARSTETAC